MDYVVGAECHLDVGIAKEIDYFSCNGVTISKVHPLFGGGGVCRWRIVGG